MAGWSTGSHFVVKGRHIVKDESSGGIKLTVTFKSKMSLKINFLLVMPVTYPNESRLSCAAVFKMEQAKS